MITTIVPYGSIGEKMIIYKFEYQGKYYAVDDLYNQLEIKKQDYDRLKCPIQKPRGRRF